jgi:fumarate reductase subunit D
LHGGGGLFDGEFPPNLISDFLMTNFSPGGEIAGLMKPLVGLLFVSILIPFGAT